MKELKELILLRFADGPLAGRGNVPDLLGALHTFAVEPDDIGGWPPPERLGVTVTDKSIGIVDVSHLSPDLLPGVCDRHGACIYRRIRMSQLTDEEITKMDHVARGAEYELEYEGGKNEGQRNTAG